MADQIEELWTRVDEHSEQISQLKIEDERIKTVLIGVNGTNGVKGKVDSMDKSFADYRQRIREDFSAMGDKFTGAMEKLTSKIEGERKARRTETLAYIGAAGTIIGILAGLGVL